MDVSTFRFAKLEYILDTSVILTAIEFTVYSSNLFRFEFTSFRASVGSPRVYSILKYVIDEYVHKRAKRAFTWLMPKLEPTETTGPRRENQCESLARVRLILNGENGGREKAHRSERVQNAQRQRQIEDGKSAK